MADPARRDILLVAASLAAPGWGAAQAAGTTAITASTASTATTATTSTARFRKSAGQPAGKRQRARPMTAAEEAGAARAVGESIADQTGESMHPAVGTSPRLRAPVKLFDGGDFTEAQARGKLLVIFYWASWCPICKIVAPKLHELWLKNRSRGLEVLALSSDSDLQAAWSHVQRTGWKFPAGMAASARLDDFMAARSLPTLMVRSRLGVVVSVDEGEVDEDDFAGYLAHL